MQFHQLNLLLMIHSINYLQIEQDSTSFDFVHLQFQDKSKNTVSNWTRCFFTPICYARTEKNSGRNAQKIRKKLGLR